MKTPHTPKRMPPEDQWSMARINNVTGTPWNPVTSSNSFRIQTNIVNGRPEFGDSQGNVRPEKEAPNNADEDDPSAVGIPVSIDQETNAQPFIELIEERKMDENQTQARRHKFHVMRHHTERYGRTKHCKACN